MMKEERYQRRDRRKGVRNRIAGQAADILFKVMNRFFKDGESDDRCSHPDLTTLTEKESKLREFSKS